MLKQSAQISPWRAVIDALRGVDISHYPRRPLSEVSNGESLESQITQEIGTVLSDVTVDDLPAFFGPRVA